MMRETLETEGTSTEAARAETRRRGIRMAMKVAALAVGAGATAMALAASEASAAGGPEPEPASGALSGDVQPVRPGGFSCVPVSRGPLAPPVQSREEFELLLAEVPA